MAQQQMTPASARAAIHIAARAEWFRSVAFVAGIAGLAAASPVVGILLSPVLIAHGARCIVLGPRTSAVLCCLVPGVLAAVAAGGTLRHASVAFLVISGFSGLVAYIVARGAGMNAPSRERARVVWPVVTSWAVLATVAVVALTMSPVNTGTLLRRDVVRPQFDTLRDSCERAEADGGTVASCDALSWEQGLSSLVTKFPERFILPAIGLVGLLSAYTGLLLARHLLRGHARRAAVLARIEMDTGPAPGPAPGAGSMLVPWTVAPPEKLVVPWWLAYAGVAGFAAIMLGQEVTAAVWVRTVAAAGWATVIVIAAAFAAQGLAVVSHAFKRLRMRRTFRILGWVLLASTPMGLGAILAVGLLDGVVDLRRADSDQDTIDGREGPPGR